MQVKVRKSTARTLDWDIEGTRTQTEMYGGVNLGAVTKTNAIELCKNDYSPGKSSHSGVKEWDYVAMLGGRQSIFDWLQMQGNAPVFSNPVHGGALFVYIARKHRRVHTDLTMVMVAPRDDLVIRQGSWDFRTPSNVKNAPEGNNGLAEITPQNLATLAHRVGQWPD